MQLITCQRVTSSARRQAAEWRPACLGQGQLAALRTTTLSGAGRDVNDMITTVVRPLVLWRDAAMRCECAYTASTWTVRLLLNDAVVEERAVDGIELLLQIAQEWRMTPTETVHESSQSQIDAASLLAEVAQLREENALLRDAALSFGALAERLSTRVRANRQ